MDTDKRYKYYFNTNKNTVIAVTTYAGKVVKGYAKLDPRDEYDEEKGKALAKARCALKVAQKRAKRAEKCYDAATADVEYAKAYQNKMDSYLLDSVTSLNIAMAELSKIEEKCK